MYDYSVSGPTPSTPRIAASLMTAILAASMIGGTAASTSEANDGAGSTQGVASEAFQLLGQNTTLETEVENFYQVAAEATWVAPFIGNFTLNVGEPENAVHKSWTFTPEGEMVRLPSILKAPISDASGLLEGLLIWDPNTRHAEGWLSSPTARGAENGMILDLSARPISGGYKLHATYDGPIDPSALPEAADVAELMQINADLLAELNEDGGADENTGTASSGQRTGTDETPGTTETCSTQTEETSEQCLIDSLDILEGEIPAVLSFVAAPLNAIQDQSAYVDDLRIPVLRMANSPVTLATTVEAAEWANTHMWEPEALARLTLQTFELLQDNSLSESSCNGQAEWQNIRDSYEHGWVTGAGNNFQALATEIGSWNGHRFKAAITYRDGNCDGLAGEAKRCGDERGETGHPFNDQTGPSTSLATRQGDDDQCHWIALYGNLIRDMAFHSARFRTSIVLSHEVGHTLEMNHFDTKIGSSKHWSGYCGYKSQWYFMKANQQCWLGHSHNQMRAGQVHHIQNDEGGLAMNFYPADPDPSGSI